MGKTTAPRGRAVAFSDDQREEAFKSKTRPGLLGCVEWTGALTNGGYGGFGGNGWKVTAHRWAYERWVGPVPDGHDLDHLCRNRRCVNVAHLEPVTHKVNVLRGTSPSAAHARKTHCINGHEFTPENTYNRPDKPWTRACRACLNRRASEKRKRLVGRGIVYSISLVRRRAVIDRFGGVCHWCGGVATSVDHIVPLRDGGSNADANLVAACVPCNSSHAGRSASWRSNAGLHRKAA